MIPLSVPNLSGNEWRYVKSCLDSNWVSSAGEFVGRFETEMCKFTGAKYAVSCVNGTAALHIALLVAGVKPDDEVIIPALTFIAPVNAIRYVGANPIFMDSDEFFNINTNKVLDFLNKKTIEKNGKCVNKLTGKTISAIIPVHIFGNAVDLDPLIKRCKKLNIKIIEDATESLGSFYLEGSLKGKHTGTIGDLGCYSFNGNKIITTGGGGMLVTDNPVYAQQALYLTTQAKDDNIFYIHNNVGYNYRMTNIQAALGVAQLEQLPDFIKIKKKNYYYYRQVLSNIPGVLLKDVPDYAFCNYWLYAITIDSQKLCLNRDQLMEYLKKNKIETRPLWYLNHLQKPFKNCYAYQLEDVEKLYNTTLNIPSSSNLTKSDIDYFAAMVKKIAAKRTDNKS